MELNKKGYPIITKIEKKEGCLYFVDADGNVCETKLKRNKKEK